MAFCTPTALPIVNVGANRPTCGTRSRRRALRAPNAVHATGHGHTSGTSTTVNTGPVGVRLGALSDATRGMQTPGSDEVTRHRLTVGERARTVVHVCKTGTLCTYSADRDGSPFGSHVDYVLCDDGRPAMLLATRAAHTLNLASDARAALFCQPTASAGQDGCRATLQGVVRNMTPEEEEEIRERYLEQHAHAADVVNSPGLFAFHVMDVNDVYYVGGFGVVAEWIDRNLFIDADPDPLAFDAPQIIQDINTKREQDLLRLCRVFLGVDDVQRCQLMGLDRLGFDLRVRGKDAVYQEFRVAFRENVNNRFDVQSALVKTFQEAWERESGFSESWADDDERTAFMYYSSPSTK